MGIIGAIAYYALVQLSEGMLQSESVLIGPIVWLPNLVLTTIALILIFRAGRHASESDRGGSHTANILIEKAKSPTM